MSWGEERVERGGDLEMALLSEEEEEEGWMCDSSSGL